MHYQPKPFELAPKAVSLAVDRENQRKTLARRVRALSDALWAIDDAEAQVRWAIAYSMSPEHIAGLQERRDQAYVNAQLKQEGV